MDDLAALALELIKERSENPPGDESGVADVIKSRLKRYMDLKEITKVENRVISFLAMEV